MEKLKHDPSVFTDPQIFAQLAMYQKNNTGPQFPDQSQLQLDNVFRQQQDFLMNHLQRVDALANQKRAAAPRLALEEHIRMQQQQQQRDLIAITTNNQNQGATLPSPTDDTASLNDSEDPREGSISPNRPPNSGAQWTYEEQFKQVRCFLSVEVIDMCL